jgi:ferritin-like protein
MGSEALHEPAEQLQPRTIETHRAIVSLMEELEAIDWYSQRIDATADEELRKILAFNREEEKVHACLVLEWIRRNDPEFATPLRRFLFTEGSIADLAEAAEHAESGGASASGPSCGDGSLGIGSLKGKP